MSTPPTSLPTAKRFISLDEAAVEFGCTRRFIEKRIEDGELSVVRPSARLIRLPRVEWERWIESFTSKKAVAS